MRNATGRTMFNAAVAAGQIRVVEDLEMDFGFMPGVAAETMINGRVHREGFRMPVLNYSREKGVNAIAARWKRKLRRYGASPVSSATDA